MNGDERTLLVDASVFITLAEVGKIELLASIDGEITVPSFVAAEITDDPAARWLDVASESGWLSIPDRTPAGECEEAAAHLGVDVPDATTEFGWITGDVALLAHALDTETSVVITDDKPLRATCKVLGIELSGSIGVLVAAVEDGELDARAARSTLYAMDEVGARLSASLVKRAEQLIDEADSA